MEIRDLSAIKAKITGDVGEGKKRISERPLMQMGGIPLGSKVWLSY